MSVVQPRPVGRRKFGGEVILDGHLDFSVIIPLEFDRGLTLQCIKGWAQGQIFPRERFQIIVAVPQNYPGSDIVQLCTVLATQDRIEKFPFRHDMPLVAAAASLACGDFLFFTEAHCLPEPDALARAYSIMLAHREWAGLSCGSIPVTHNMLSRIEAEMYDKDIRRNLENHPWLKVLDQCLVVRREAYEKSGGIEPEYGHFAEWLFAARAFRSNMQIGYDPAPAIRHYYIGRLYDLKLFTLDFAEGEIRFMAQGHGDPRTGLFAEIPELTNRRQWGRGDAWYMTRILWRSLLLLSVRWLLRLQPPAQGSAPPHHGLMSGLLTWSWRTVSGIRGALLIAKLRALSRGLGVRWYLLTGHQADAKNAFLKWITCLVHVARLDFLRRSKIPDKSERITRNVTQASGGLFVDTDSTIDFMGFHPLENHNGKSLRWSSSIAVIFIPLMAGAYRITLEWDKVRNVSGNEPLIFHFNGHFISRHQLCLRAHAVEIYIKVESLGTQRLGWNIVPFPAQGDTRDLGLPIQKVSWEMVDPLAIQAQHLPWKAR